MSGDVRAALDAALLTAIQCRWITMRDRATQMPVVSLCEWCGKRVRGGPGECTVRAAVTAAAREGSE